jgi:AAA domain
MKSAAEEMADYERGIQDELDKITPGTERRKSDERNSRRANGDGRSRDGSAAAGAKPFTITLAKDITLEPKESLIDGFIGRYETSAWFGPPDAGKSTVMVDAMGCVAAGKEYCGRGVMRGPCLYVAAERGAIVRRRVVAWCREHGLPDIPFAVLDHAVDLRTGKVDTDRIIVTAEELGKLCGQSVIWIAFDTLNRILAGGDENSPKDMGAVIASLDRIHRSTRAHCSLIHHVPHDRTDRMRGHGLVLGAVDMTIRITKDSAAVQVQVDKANDLVDKPGFAFSFKSVTVHVDPERGTETSAPVLVPLEGAATAKPQAKPARMPKAMQTALRALQKAVDEAGETPPASNNVPSGIRVASFDQWRQYAYASGISTSGENRARQQAFKRASEYLIGGNHVGAWNEQAWPV